MDVRIYYSKWSEKEDSHNLLKIAVEQYLGREADSFTVCRKQEYGKPCIMELPGVCFSISHSAGMWACAISDREVGLDIQECRAHMDAERLAVRFFHPSEVEWLREHGYENFSRVWARKESYVKYTGIGLKNGLDYFSVVDGLPAIQRDIPFRDDFQMALTTEGSAKVQVTEL